MANSVVCLQPPAPAPFNFKSPDDRPCWRRRFQQFHEASGLTAEGATKQVSALLYCMGETAEDVLTSTDISKGDKKKFDSVIAKFDSFFKVRKNGIFERVRLTAIPKRTVSRWKSLLPACIISWRTVRMAGYQIK